MWKNIEKSKEVLILEKQLKQNNLNIRIESRELASKKWDVYMSLYNEEGVKHVAKFHTKSKSNALDIVRLLKSRANYPSIVSNIDKLKGFDEREAKFVNNMRRLSKDFNVEKWEVNVIDNKHSNYVYVFFDETLKCDIVLHEEYMPFQDDIIKELENILALYSPIKFNVFFYRGHIEETKEQKSEEESESQIDINLEIR